MLAGWLAGRMSGWLAGWLAGCRLFSAGCGWLWLETGWLAGCRSFSTGCGWLWLETVWLAGCGWRLLSFIFDGLWLAVAGDRVAGWLVPWWAFSDLLFIFGGLQTCR